jgi:hypothetical protein
MLCILYIGLQTVLRRQWSVSVAGMLCGKQACWAKASQPLLKTMMQLVAGLQEEDCALLVSHFSVVTIVLNQ